MIKRRRRTRTAGVASPTYAWKYLSVQKNSWMICVKAQWYISALTMPRISVLVSPQCSTCGRNIQLIFPRTKSKYKIMGSLVHVTTAADTFYFKFVFKKYFGNISALQREYRPLPSLQTRRPSQGWIRAPIDQIYQIRFILFEKTRQWPSYMTFISFAECFWNLEKPECDEDEEIESDSCLPESDWAKVWISEKRPKILF